MNKLIKQLKNNEKPFGLMSEEMQAKAKEIGRSGNFSVFACGGWQDCTSDSGVFDIWFAYRLNADYTEPAEDEYELCEIHMDAGQLCYQSGKYPHVFLASAVGDPNFAGYLYEDGEMSPFTVKYRYNGIICDVVREQHRGEAEVLRPTHIVFKK